jgi:hypothetical protein
MPKPKSFEESLKAVNTAEKAVYEAQSNENVEERQQAFMQLRFAREKVQIAQKELDKANVEEHERLEHARQHLHHLEEAQQALEE